MIAKLNPISGWLLVALVVSTGWGAFATYRWATASSRCDTRIASEKGSAEAVARDHYATALRVAASIFDGSRAQTRDELGDASGSMQGRAVQIVRVPVSGSCVMPKGLPDLAPAVQEARDAARD